MLIELWRCCDRAVNRIDWTRRLRAAEDEIFCGVPAMACLTDVCAVQLVWASHGSRVATCVLVATTRHVLMEQPTDSLRVWRCSRSCNAHWWGHTMMEAVHVGWFAAVP